MPGSGAVLNIDFRFLQSLQRGKGKKKKQTSLMHKPLKKFGHNTKCIKIFMIL